MPSPMYNARSSKRVHRKTKTNPNPPALYDLIIGFEKDSENGLISEIAIKSTPYE